jgi:hypothetical protein
MKVLYERVAGIDVHKDMVKVAIRSPGNKPWTRKTEILKFRTFYGVFQHMARELRRREVTHVVPGPSHPSAWAGRSRAFPQRVVCWVHVPEALAAIRSGTVPGPAADSFRSSELAEFRSGQGRWRARPSASGAWIA